MPVAEQFNLDRRLANMLGGEWDLTALDHMGRVVALTNLLRLFEAVDKMGWHTHTSDWDWEVTVAMANGTEYCAINMPYHLEYKKVREGEEYARGTTAMPEGYTACVDHAQIQEMVVYHTPQPEEGEETGNDEDKPMTVRIDDVVKVRFEELG